MKIGKKGLVAIALCVIVIASALAYSLITTQWTVHSHLKILGGALEVWQWETGETYSLTYDSDDFGGMIPGTSKESKLLVLNVGSGTSINQKLSYSTTLPTDVGYIQWQVELSYNLGGSIYEWKWFNWTNSPITVDLSTGQTVYLPGSPNNPIQPLQRIGIRSTQTPTVAGLVGHFKYIVITYPTAPCADYNFDIIVTGTEVS